MADRPVLIALSYSPWSEKARWALEATGVAYDYEEYTPMLGEIGLRARTGRWKGKVTVPTMLVGRDVYGDSWEIAAWAQAHATSGVDLLPAEHLDAIEAWNAVSEKALAAGRIRASRAALDDRDAMLASMPEPLRKLGPLTGAIGETGVKYLLKKYDGAEFAPERVTAELRDACHALREGLGDGRYLVDGRFTYADVVMALMLQFVAPLDDAWIKIGRARPIWTDPTLATEFPDLVAWRDQLFRDHRRS